MNDKKEETEEKPKAVVEMEENSDAGKAKRKIKEKKEQNAKEANRKFIIKYIVFTVGLVLITIGAIYFSIKQLNKNVEEATTETIDTSKQIAADSKYAINSYAETYDENSLNIKYYAGNDQLVENTYGGEEYVQIEGLLDKDIQNNINKRLKDTAKKLKEGNRRTFSQVTANFGNILSVYIYNEDSKRETINVDLTTGNNISIEDVFVSSAPINSLIMEGVFKSLAWDKLSSNYETIMGTLDMNKVDTSQYEDIALKVVNNFKSKEENVFFITTEGITIYGITDQNMFISDNEDSGIIVDFIGHREDVAIYKRYLTNKSIYENDSIGAKDIIVFTDNIYDDKYIYNLLYEQEDNVFVEEALLYYEGENNNKNTFEIIKKYLINMSNEDKHRVESQTKSDLGAFYQKEINIWKSEKYYCASITEYQATCDISYFKDEAFKDYAKMKNGPRADVGINGFTEYDKEEYPNLQISKTKTSELYFDLDGNYIGVTEAEAKTKLNENETKLETEETTTESTDINTNTNTNSSLNTSINEENTSANDNSNIIENKVNQENNTISQ